MLGRKWGGKKYPKKTGKRMSVDHPARGPVTARPVTVGPASRNSATLLSGWIRPAVLPDSKCVPSSVSRVRVDKRSESGIT